MDHDSSPCRPVARTVALTLAISACTIALSACIQDDASRDEDDSLSVQGLQQDLFIEKMENVWQNSQIPICFSPSRDVWDNRRAAYNARKTEIRQWVEATYESLPNIGLDFTGWSECPNYASFARNDEGTGRIELWVADNGAGGSTSSNGRSVLMGLTTARGTIIHEIAHTLAFQHEHHRSDSTGSTGTWDDLQMTPRRCIDEVLFDLLPDGSVGPRRCNPNKSHKVIYGVYLTSYDFWSITNSTYCHCRERLSDLDRLGLEIVYPTTASLNGATAVRVDHGFRLGDGTTLTFLGKRGRHDWFVRGVHAQAFSNQGVFWKAAPFTGGGSLDTGAGFRPNTSGIYRADWTDFRGRSRSTAKVEFNSSKATALLVGMTAS